MYWRRWLRAAWKQTQYLLIGLMILWLAVLYPALCEYHGLLLFRVSHPQAILTHTDASTLHSGHEHRMEHYPAGMTTLSAIAMGNHHHAIEDSGLAEQRHKRAPVESSAAGLPTVAVPDPVKMLSLLVASSLMVFAPAFAHQSNLAPPDQPPRLFA